MSHEYMNSPKLARGICLPEYLSAGIVKGIHRCEAIERAETDHQGDMV